MLNTIKVHIVGPLMARMGTAVATLLAPYVVNPDHRIAIGAGVAAVGCVAYDLVVGYFGRTALANKVFSDTVEGILKGRVE